MSDEATNPMPFDRSSDEYRRLVAAIADGSVLFVGAGSSCRVGHPNWNKLLKGLAEAAKKAQPDKASEIEAKRDIDGLLQASSYREHLGPIAYGASLREAFGPRTPPHHAFHELLLGVPFRHVLTTNVDGVLESAHDKISSSPARAFDVDQWELLAEFRQSRLDARYGRRYVHVHGSIGRPEGIVLCKEDYNSRYVQETRAKDFLCDVFVGQRVVFVGFSLEDDDLVYLLRLVEGSLEPIQPRHFALLAKPKSEDDARIQRENFQGRFAVEPVYYDNTTGDHSSLETLIVALGNDVRAELASRGGSMSVAAVPRLIEELFADRPELLQEALNQRLPGLLARYAEPLSVRDGFAEAPSGIGAEITRLFTLVDKGLPDDAIEEYAALRTKHESALTAKQRYRIEANIGHALNTKGQTAAAAAAYLRAVGFYRESRDAQGLEVLAHLLQGDLTGARVLAVSLCEREPGFGRARSLWVRAQPDDVAFDHVEKDVPEALRADPEVALSLSDLARRTGDAANQERYARAAVTAMPKWPDATATLACAIVMSEKDSASFNADRVLIPKNPERVSEAEHLLTMAIETTPRPDPGSHLADLHFNRSVARRMAGDEHGARNDLCEAFRRDRTDPAIVLAFAGGSESGAEIKAALAALEAFPLESPERDQLQMAYIELLARRREPGDLELALLKTEELSSRLSAVSPLSLRRHVVIVGMRLLRALGRSVDSPGFVSNLPAEALSPEALAALQGRANLMTGNKERAEEHAREAIRLTGAEAGWFERREVALLAQECGLYAEAITVWESIVAPEEVGSDTVHLVRCAYYAGDWKMVLGICRRVREAGRLRREHMQAEVDVLTQSRELGRAMSVLQEWLRANPEDKQARLYLTVHAIQQGCEDLAEFDESKLPSVEDVKHAGDGAALVHVIRRGPHPGRALDTAYRLYRRFPDDIGAHHTLIRCIFDPSAPPLDIVRPTVVGANTAVCVRRENEVPYWLYVEDGADPDVTRREYPPTHELVRALWGKKKGDQVRFQERNYTIVGIEDRALRRAHESMDQYQENFPDGRLLRRFEVPEDIAANATPEESLGELAAVLKAQEQHWDALRSLYLEDQLPLTSFARCLGRPVFDVLHQLASQPAVGVRAANGDEGQWDAAVASLRDRPQIVIDATVLSGAVLLGILDDLPRLGFKLIVTHALYDEFRAMSLNAADPGSPTASIGFRQNQLFVHEYSSSEVAHRVRTLERVLKFMHEHCEIVGGEATLDLPVVLRARLEKIVGEAATDALALAKQRACILWTDDAGLRHLATQADLGVRSVWTQTTLFASREAGRMSNEDYTAAVGGLLVHGYKSTLLTARDFVTLFRRAGWRSDTRLGAVLIQIAAEVGLHNHRNRLISALALLMIWRECPQETLARELIGALLDAIGRKRSGPLLAAFVYRMNGVQGWKPPEELHSLKRLLRSWRSRDRAFRPSRTQRRNTPRFHFGKRGRAGSSQEHQQDFGE